MRTSCAHIVTSRRADWPATFEHGAFRSRESRVISTRFPSRSSFPSRSRETYRWKIHRSITRFYLYDFIYRAIAFLQRIIKRFSRIISNLARPRRSTSHPPFSQWCSPTFRSLRVLRPKSYFQSGAIFNPPSSSRAMNHDR